MIVTAVQRITYTDEIVDINGLITMRVDLKLLSSLVLLEGYTVVHLNTASENINESFPLHFFREPRIVEIPIAVEHVTTESVLFFFDRSGFRVSVQCLVMIDHKCVHDRLTLHGKPR